MPRAPTFPCAELPRKVLLTVEEETVGAMSDNDTQVAGILTIIAAAYMLVMTIVVYCSTHRTV